MIDCDVVVVGAGPAGSHAAYRLASLGYEVVVLEEHGSIGVPTSCSGLIGREAFERFDLPRRAVLRGFDRARFVSPGGEVCEVSAGEVVAYVVDRAEFDRSLADRARAAGAAYRLGSRCVGLERENGRVRLWVDGPAGPEEVVARAAVLAGGIRFGLLDRVGIARPRRLLHTAQAELALSGVEEIEVYLGREVAGGSFAWAIPTAGGQVKLGVCAPGRVIPLFARLLAGPRIAPRRRDGAPPRVRSKPIPVQPARRTAYERVLVVGDAAGQVKPTTAGGIYYGIVCAELAARALHEGFRRGDLSAARLADYERSWRAELGRELRVGAAFRRIGERLDDVRLDRLVRAFREPEIRDLVRHASFERHSSFILALARTPLVWRLLLAPARGRARPAVA